MQQNVCELGGFILNYLFLSKHSLKISRNETSWSHKEIKSNDTVHMKDD